MSMLDQMLIEGVRRTAPENKPWNAGQFLTNVGQFVNTGERINELQRQNSLRNLIKQREQDGVSFDRLSNEAAKYDLNKALTMRNEARDSIKFNRTESEAELANHKKYMAGWLGGEVLRRAQETVARGDAQWDFDYVVKVCNEAAAVIFPYDHSTATALINFGKQGLGAAKKSQGNVKRVADDTNRIVANKNKNFSTNPDANKDKFQVRKNRITGYVDDAILRWKNNGKYDPEEFGWNHGYDRSIYAPMESILYNEALKKFPGMIKTSTGYNSAIKWLESLDDKALSSILKPVEDEEQKQYVSEEKPAQDKKTVGNSSVVKPGLEKLNLSEGVKLPKSLTYLDPDWGTETYSEDAKSELDMAIPYLVSDKDFKQAFKLAAQIPHTESGEAMAYNETQKAIRDQQKLIYNIKGGKKVSDAFVRAMMDKVANSGRTATAFNAQMTALASFVTGAETSRSSLTLINNGLLALLPFYKPTDYDAKAALSTIHNDSKWDDVKTVIANLGLPIFSDGAKLANIDAAIDAMIDDVNQRFAGWGDTLVEDAETEEERKQIRGDIDKRWAFGKKGMRFLFKDDGNVHPILSGEERLEAINQNAQSQKAASKKEAELRKKESGSLGSVYDNTAGKSTSGKTMSASEWLKKRREEKGGK